VITGRLQEWTISRSESSGPSPPRRSRSRRKRSALPGSPASTAWTFGAPRQARRVVPLSTKESGFLKNETLTAEKADVMIENVIGVFGLPLGVAVNFRINDKDYVIPMAVEETSIVAACSHMAKMIGSTAP